MLWYVICVSTVACVLACSGSTKTSKASLHLGTVPVASISRLYPITHTGNNASKNQNVSFRCLKVCVDADCQMSLCVASYLESMSATSSILSVKCILYVRSIRPFGFRRHKPHLGRVGRCHKGTLEGQERNAKDLARPG